jgi:hypothetical protein
MSTPKVFFGQRMPPKGVPVRPLRCAPLLGSTAGGLSDACLLLRCPPVCCAFCHADISIGGKPAGRIVMELRADVVPKTAGQSTPLLLPAAACCC